MASHSERSTAPRLASSRRLIVRLHAPITHESAAGIIEELYAELVAAVRLWRTSYELRPEPDASGLVTKPDHGARVGGDRREHKEPHAVSTDIDEVG